jgi:uncharacterized protein YgbK (DUF1537 family)
MIKLLVIADDLTGALDAGVHFSTIGIRTVVIPDTDFLHPDGLADISCEVVVVNTESRHISGQKAADLVKKVAGLGKRAGAKILYKKTDSTLRGNIGAELEALLDSMDLKRIPFIPAYPAVKRFTRHGYHYVDNHLLHRTRFADDPLEPIHTSYIPEILYKQIKEDISIKILSLDQPIQSVDHSGKQILVFDCNNENDLRSISHFLDVNDMLGVVKR